jgi:hypothetical protein
MIITGNFNVPGVPPQRSVPDHLVVAIEYIRMQLMNDPNGALSPDWFDEDHQPLGPKLRAELRERRYIIERPEGIYLNVPGFF